MNQFSRRLLAALAIAAGLSSPAAAGGLMGARALAKSGEAGPIVSAVSLSQGAGAAKLTFEMTSTVEANAYVLDDPARVIVDLPETAFVLDPASGRAGQIGQSGLIRSYRFGLIAPGKSRIVIDLSGPAKIQRVSSGVTPAGGAYRLAIELASGNATAFRAAASEARKTLVQLAEPAPVIATRPLVVLDPGHGGIDLGAVSKDVQEKQIVFDFAKALADRLKAGGEVRCMMTRTDDTFIPLAERVQIAQQANANLFVSIHADTLFEANVQGATAYTLSDRASDAHAARVADNENASDRVGGAADRAEAAGVNDILSDLTRRETKVLSRSFARGLVSAWRDVGDLNKNPLRSAGFRVLKAPDFPSVLFELGYLSNAADLKNLSSAEWREKAVERVAQSIERFLRTQPNDMTAVVASDRDATASIETR